ncbi:MAG: hypothetical protein ACK4ZJ_20120 [Allorhizobium sp.]
MSDAHVGAHECTLLLLLLLLLLPPPPPPLLLQVLEIPCTWRHV